MRGGTLAATTGSSSSSTDVSGVSYRSGVCMNRGKEQTALATETNTGGVTVLYSNLYLINDQPDINLPTQQFSWNSHAW